MVLSFKDWLYNDIKENSAEYAADLLKVCINIPLIPLGLLPSKAMSYIEEKSKGWYVPEAGCIFTSFVEYRGGFLLTLGAMLFTAASAPDNNIEIVLENCLWTAGFWFIAADGYAREKMCLYEDKVLGLFEGLYRAVKDKKYEYLLLNCEYE